MTPPIAGPDAQKYHPSCLLAHELVNKLAVVVGYCDLFEEPCTRRPRVPHAIRRDPGDYPKGWRSNLTIIDAKLMS
jgi:hypothetical protein